MTDMVVGVDPGIGGAIAVTFPEDPSRAEVFDMPLVTTRQGKSEVSAVGVSDIFRECLLEGPVHVRVERVSAMPGQGVTSMFTFGMGYGVIIGVVQALSLSMERVTPQIWKRAAGLTGADKDYARTRAIELYPGLADQLARKKDIGRADALLIARFG